MTEPPRAGRREWLGLVVLLLPTALMTADLGVLWLATPYFTADLQPSSSQLLWITDIYGFLTAGFLVIMGTLGDRMGRRRLLVIGSAGFAVASLLAAYASGPEMLIAARALLGLAGAAVLPSTLSLISHMFADPGQRRAAIAAWVTALSVGIAIGPVAGGVLMSAFWWGSVFLMGVPVVALPIVFARALLPEYRDPNAGRPDLPSVALFLAGVLPVIYGIKTAASYGPDLRLMLAVAIGGVAGWLFVRRQFRLADPLLDLRLIANRTIAGALLMLVMGMMALNGVEYLVPQYLQLVAGRSALDAGLWMLPSAAGLVVGSQLTTVLVRRVRPATVLAAGLLTMTAGFMLIAQVGPDDVALAATGLTLTLLGVAPISVLGTELAVGAAPPERAGTAAATGQTAYDLGLALGIALTGSVAVAVYRGELEDALPAGTPAAEAEAARGTLGGAVDAVEHLPEPVGTALLAAGREAFTTGFHAAAWVSTGLGLAVAVLVVALLRHLPPAGRQTPSSADRATQTVT